MARERPKLVLDTHVSVDGFVGRLLGERDAWQLWD